MVRRLGIVFVLGLLAAYGSESEPESDSGCGRACGCGGAGEAGAPKGPIGMKAGSVVYALEGQRKGTMTAWFDDHGDTVVVELDTTVFRQPERKKLIWRDGRSIVCDLGSEDKDVHAMGIRPKGTELWFLSDTSPKNREYAGYARAEDEEIAGVTCEVWENEKSNGKVAWHRGLLMRYDIGDAQKRVATSFERMDAIRAEVLELPRGFTVK